MNVAEFIKTKSDRLNADDLMGVEEITVQIEEVVRGDADQPVRIKISGGWKPWHPCLTCRKILAAVMSTDSTKWQGHWMTLYREPSVRFGGIEVGGVRIKALSAIDEPVMLSLNEKRGRKAPHKINPLSPPKSGGEAAGAARGSAASQGARAPGADSAASDSTASPGPHHDSDGAGAPGEREPASGPSTGAVLLTTDQLTLIREAIQAKAGNDTAYARWVGKLCAAYSVERMEEIPREKYDEIAGKLGIEGF